MALPTIPDPPGFAELSPAEQIDFLQRLWDRIAADELAIPVRESHFELAEDRLAAHRAQPDAARPVEELLDRLGRRHP
ncbi:MAG: addiction module protein [Armatimonadetes bacterium]|nr:addiction module protein [Armatimonadota bacterium]